MIEPELIPKVTKPSSDEVNIAVLSHIAGACTFFIGPLIIWLIYKNAPRREYVAQQSLEALNFQTTMAIIHISLYLCGFIPGLLLSPPLLVIQFFLSLFAAVRCSQRRAYRYPLTLRLFT